MSATKTTKADSSNVVRHTRAHRADAAHATAKPAAKKKKADHATDGHGLSEHVAGSKKRDTTHAGADAAGVAGHANKAVWAAHNLLVESEFEVSKPSGKEFFTRAGVDAGTTSKYREVSAENDTISVRLGAPDFNLTVPQKDDKFAYVVFQIAEGATAEKLAKDMTAVLAKERGYTTEIKPNARTGGVDLKVFDKQKKPVKITDRMTQEMPGLGFRGNTISIPKIDAEQKPAEVTIELGKKKVKVQSPPFESVKKLAERIAEAVEKEGYNAAVDQTKWGTDVKISRRDALAVDVHRVKKDIEKEFDAVAKYAEVGMDSMATYALRLEPARLKALEKGDPTELKLFLLKATHGIENFEYELGDGKGINGNDAIKGRDVAVPDQELKEKHLRPKDGYVWKILARDDVFEHGLRYIFENDDEDFKAELAANQNGEQENRAKLEESLKTFEASFLDFKATSYHLIRMPDQGVGSAYAVLALDSKHGEVRVAGNYGEPGGPPSGVFG